MPRARFLRARSVRRAQPGSISPERERELESLRRIATELARTSDVEGVARALLDEISALFSVGFVALTFVSDDAREGAGFLARKRGKDVDWWPSVRVDLEHEPSGIASAVRDATSFTIYDAAGSPKVSARLTNEVGAKSAAFVPLISDSGVIAVISVATTDEQRVFSPDDLGVMQTLASEATIALERTRSSLALGEALARERLLSGISRRLRTELDLDAALTATVEEAGRALGASRCFVRLGDFDGELPVIAQWHAAGARPLGEDADRLAVFESRCAQAHNRRRRRPRRRRRSSRSRRSAASTRCARSARVPSCRRRSSSRTGRSACSPRTATRRARGAAATCCSSRRSRRKRG